MDSVKTLDVFSNGIEVASPPRYKKREVFCDPNYLE